MVMRVRKAGMAMRGSFQSMEDAPASMRAPTRMRAGAGAKSGMATAMRPTTMAAMWMKKSRQVVAAWWAGWTSSMGLSSIGLLEPVTIQGLDEAQSFDSFH